MTTMLARSLATCSLLVAIVLAPVARGAEAPAADEKMTVVFVGEGKISVKPGNGKDKSVKSTKYKVTADTKITINGEPGELSAIKPGHKVVIVPSEGDAEVAASITLTKSADK